MNTRSGLGGILGAAVLIGATFGFAGQSQAALIGCPASFTTDGTAKVTHDNSTNTAAGDCQYVDPPDQSNVASIDNINAAGFFGTSDWEDNGQTQVDPGANASSGSWSIANVDFVAFDYIIVFKDGSLTNLIAFLFNEEVAFGDWITPFVDPPFTGVGENGKDVSHFTIARREGEIPPPPPQVPEPGTLTLFGAGLIALAMVVRRGSRQS